jgi:hypothetical protein
MKPIFNNAFFFLLISFLSVQSIAQDQIPGLELWLSADQGVSISNDGAVTTWTDRSDNGRNAGQATALQQPTLVGSSIKCLYFDGIDDNLDINLSFLANSEYTIFCVASSNTYNYPNYALTTTGRTANEAFNFGFARERCLRLAQWSNDLQIKINRTEVEEQLNIWGGRLTGNLNEGQSIWFNGERIADRYSVDFLESVGGGKIGAGSIEEWMFRGTIAEILIYSRALSIYEMDFVNNYLAQKYRIRVHPELLPTISQKFDHGGLDASFSALFNVDGDTLGTARLPFVEIMDNGLLTTNSVFYIYGSEESGREISGLASEPTNLFLSSELYAESVPEFSDGGSVIFNATYSIDNVCTTATPAYLLFRDSPTTAWALEAQTFMNNECGASFGVDLRDGYYGFAVPSTVALDNSQAGVILE